jgi:hypothetical protein
MQIKTTSVVIFLTLLSSFKGFSQVANEHITDDYSVVRYKVGGAVQRLSKENTYKIIFPLKMAYNNETETKNLWGYTTLNMDAKKIKDGTASDKTFEVVSSGLVPTIRFEDIQWPMPTNPSASGFVRKVYFKFPLKVIVKNVTGAIEKELIVADSSSETYAIFHAGMLAQDVRTLASGRPIMPYLTPTDLNNAYAASKAAIEKKLEIDEIYNASITITRAIYAGYDYNNFAKAALYYYSIKKADKVNYPQIVENTEKLGFALKDYADTAKQAAAFETLKTSYAYFKEQLNNRSTFAPDIVKLFLYDGALAAVVTGNLDDANKWFSDYYANYCGRDLGMATLSVENFVNLFPVFSAYYAIKQSQSSTINFNKRLTYIEDNVMAKNKKYEEKKIANVAEQKIAEANNPNIKREEGYVIFDNGEKVNGKISFLFTPEEGTEVASNDVGRKVYLTTNPLINFDKDPRKVAFFFAKGNMYELIGVKEASVMGMLNKMSTGSGLLQKKQYYKIYYEVGIYKVYQNPLDAANFVIRKQGDEKGTFVNDIYKDKKAAKNFIENCTILKQRVDAKDTFADFTDVKMFADFLNANCK